MGVTVKVIELAPEEKIREVARRREKRLHDEATALNFAIKEGRAERDAELTEIMRKKGFTEEQIKDILGE